MLFETYGQAYVFLATVYGGLCSGFAYDINRALRILFMRPRYMRHIIDCAFWIAAGAFFAIAVLRANEGRLRLYTALGFAVGWVLYALALSPIIMRLIRYIIGILRSSKQWLLGLGIVKRILK